MSPDTQAALAAAQRQIADMAAAHEAFVRAVVHDLRAPLRHVTSYGALTRELLQELPGTAPEVAEALGFVATMEQSARRMAAMLEGLRAIAHAGGKELQRAPQDLPALLEAVRAELEPAQAGRGLRWQVELAPGLPLLDADGALLRALLLQLLSNALKFTRAVAQPCIALRAGPAQDGRVHIVLQDNGVGFEPARAGMLLGVFQRLHRESEFEGVGAGLALCKTIAERHGAQIAISAEPGAGCRVTLDWPAA